MKDSSMPKKRSKTVASSKKAVELDLDDDVSSDPIEEYSHGSLYNGDTPPDWVARAIANALEGIPYKDVPTPDLEALSRDLREAVEKLSLVNRVLQARQSAW
jgi:hypothetical protein